MTSSSIESSSNPSGITFMGIDMIRPHWRGCNKRRAVSMLETKWIYEMHTLSLLGLNIEVDLNS